MTPGSGIEPGAHWWKASALITAPSLLPFCKPFEANNVQQVEIKNDN